MLPAGQSCAAAGGRVSAGRGQLPFFDWLDRPRTAYCVQQFLQRASASSGGGQRERGSVGVPLRIRPATILRLLVSWGRGAPPGGHRLHWPPGAQVGGSSWQLGFVLAEMRSLLIQQSFDRGEQPLITTVCRRRRRLPPPPAAAALRPLLIFRAAPLPPCRASLPRV